MAQNIVLVCCLMPLTSFLLINARPRDIPEIPNRPAICANMKPTHNNPPQKLPPPFSIEMSSESYYPGEDVTVTIKGKGDFRFRGFFIQARRADWRENQTAPIGFWTSQAGSKVICSERNGNGLTHTNDADGSDFAKKQLQLHWKAPEDQSKGHLEFRVTIVSTYEDYWVAERSAVLKDPSARALPTKQSPNIEQDIPVPDIKTGTCGKDHGCYREPADCQETCVNEGCVNCDALVQWQDRGDQVDFQLSADSDGWVALGFSEDKHMGAVSLVECLWKAQQSAVVVQASYIEGNNIEPEDDTSVMGLSRMSGFKSNGRLKCVFTRSKEVRGQDNVQSLDVPVYMLLGRGDVSDDSGTKEDFSMEPSKRIMISPYAFETSDHEDVTGRARYPLIKVHGCLMIVAWMMCGSFAIIMARYYKPMWPNDRVCGQRVWFSIHQGCNLVAVICTIIAFIIIFVQVGGYSQLPELPLSAHPPIGITVTVLVVLNPLLSLCRCKTGARLRPLFNWFHWLFGTAAFVLAAPAMFIGMSMYKAFVPWWATWVMVAFMLFHIIIELMLEIHGCINGPKQKSRSAEYQLTKQREVSGYEPDPVGTRFKTTLISIYVVVMLICGIIMVIAVAAG